MKKIERDINYSISNEVLEDVSFYEQEKYKRKSSEQQQKLTLLSEVFPERLSMQVMFPGFKNMNLLNKVIQKHQSQKQKKQKLTADESDNYTLYQSTILDQTIELPVQSAENCFSLPKLNPQENQEVYITESKNNTYFNWERKYDKTQDILSIQSPLNQPQHESFDFSNNPRDQMKIQDTATFIFSKEYSPNKQNFNNKSNSRRSGENKHLKKGLKLSQKQNNLLVYQQDKIIRRERYSNDSKANQLSPSFNNKMTFGNDLRYQNDKYNKQKRSKSYSSSLQQNTTIINKQNSIQQIQSNFHKLPTGQQRENQLADKNKESISVLENCTSKVQRDNKIKETQEQLLRLQSKTLNSQQNNSIQNILQNEARGMKLIDIISVEQKKFMTPKLISRPSTANQSSYLKRRDDQIEIFPKSPKIVNTQKIIIQINQSKSNNNCNNQNINTENVAQQQSKDIKDIEICHSQNLSSQCQQLHENQFTFSLYNENQHKQIKNQKVILNFGCSFVNQPSSGGQQKDQFDEQVEQNIQQIQQHTEKNKRQFEESQLTSEDVNQDNKNDIQFKRFQQEKEEDDLELDTCNFQESDKIINLNSFINNYPNSKGKSKMSNFNKVNFFKNNNNNHHSQNKKKQLLNNNQINNQNNSPNNYDHKNNSNNSPLKLNINQTNGQNKQHRQLRSISNNQQKIIPNQNLIQSPIMKDNLSFILNNQMRKNIYQFPKDIGMTNSMLPKKKINQRF